MAAEGGSVVLAKWVFALISDGNGKVTKAKVRLVERGFSPCLGLDNKETSPLTPAAPCIPLMASIPLRVVVGLTPL